MRCLWITLADPDPPRNGQFLYSRVLIEGVSAAGAEIHVVGLARPRGSHRSGQHTDGVHWWLAEHQWSADHQASSRWVSLLSDLPQIAAQTNTPPMRQLIADRLGDGPWDAIVFDSICAGWALSMVKAHYAGKVVRPTVLYLSHNHEESVARAIARTAGLGPKRSVRELDALKVARLERWLVRSADVVTSNSPDDCEKFRPHRPDRRVEFLPPAYTGRRVAARMISADMPRRAIIVGSFDWIAKRVSLEQFLKVADPLFTRAGIELFVVGSAEDGFLNRVRNEVTATRLTGRVEDIGHYMDQARLALVPDLLGGFKLKALDYAFNRLPMLAMAGAVPGMPLVPNESILLYQSHQALAEGVVAVIDDLELLNKIQNQAYTACGDQFDGDVIGRRLVRFMSPNEQLRPRPAGREAWSKVGSVDSPA
jgi:glycosyltransferase involved in cell wall biosynthesis